MKVQNLGMEKELYEGIPLNMASCKKEMPLLYLVAGTRMHNFKLSIPEREPT